ncbi:MAG: glycyl radical protein [Dehalococcoidales bacterium]|nr:glycyl radical protein [Dehalococcoidales bacterium]
MVRTRPEGTLDPVHISERITRLKDQAMGSVPRICAERVSLMTESWFANAALPAVLRRAEALAAILRQMTIFIADEELLVGNQTTAIRAAPIFPEYAVEWLGEELDSLPDRKADPFLVSPDVAEELRRLIPRWKGHTHEDRVLATLPREVLEGWQEIKAFNLVPLTSCGPAHLAVDFPTVLREGLAGVIGRAERRMAGLDLTSPSDLDQLPFLQSVGITGRAAIDFGKRYATLARSLAGAESRESRRSDLLEIADVCERVPGLPPRTFREAVQATWFVQLILQIESSGHSVSLGRVDQYLYPFFAADKAAGRLTGDEAAELIANLWIKLFWVNKVRPWANTQYAAGYPMYQNATIGGQTPDGADATNELTYMCLRAMDATRLPSPNLSARYHHRSPEPYLRVCAETIGHGYGMPAMENDETIIPSLLARGVALADAHDYAMIGCVEVAVPGRWGYRCNGMTFLNLMKVHELSLWGGRDPASGLQPVPEAKDLTSFASFDEVMDAWRRQLAYYTRLTVVADSVVDASLGQVVPDPFCSALVRDCIGRGKTLNEGGAVYDMISGSQVGVANVANSLAALKKLVFEERAVSGAELASALRDNWAGPEGEALRQLVLNKAPKYGNDDDYVDGLAVGAYGDFIREIGAYRNRRYGRGPVGGTYFSSTSTVSANVPAGMAVGATPDGRRAGESLAEGSSPHPGTDVLGPTAAIRLVTKLPALEITGGQILNLKFSPDTLAGPGSARLVALLRAFAELRGWHVQFNVVSSETLREAQRHPEEYRSLMVRVAGYCALFTTIDKATQDNIIRRTEHQLG